MDIPIKKVRVLSYRPHQVTYEMVNSSRRVTVPRGRFERRLDLGFYEVLNPELLPHI